MDEQHIEVMEKMRHHYLNLGLPALAYLYLPERVNRFLDPSRLRGWRYVY